MRSEYYVQSHHNSFYTTHHNSVLHPLPTEPTPSPPYLNKHLYCLTDRAEILPDQHQPTEEEPMQLEKRMERVTSQNTVKAHHSISHHSAFNRSIIKPRQQKSINAREDRTVCPECQKSKNSIRALKLSLLEKEEGWVQTKQQFLQMERKYLLKQNQYLQLQQAYESMYKKIVISEQCNLIYKQEAEEKQEIIENYQKQLQTIQQQLKSDQNTQGMLGYFLEKFITLSESVIRWSEIFDRLMIKETPVSLMCLKEELQSKRGELSFEWKEANQISRILRNDACLNQSKEDISGLLADEEETKRADVLQEIRNSSARNPRNNWQQLLTESKHKMLHSFKENNPNISNSQHSKTANEKKDKFQHYIASGNKYLQKQLFAEKGRRNLQIDEEKLQLPFLRQPEDDDYYRILLAQASAIQNQCGQVWKKNLNSEVTCKLAYSVSPNEDSFLRSCKQFPQD